MLSGIRPCCCWSKLQRVSPCWPASNPPFMHVVRAGDGAQLGDSQPTPWPHWKGNLFTAFAQKRQLLQSPKVSGGAFVRGSLTDSWEARLLPKSRKSRCPSQPPQPIPLSQNLPAGRQEWHISMTLFSLDSAAYHKEMRISIAYPSCFFFTYFYREPELNNCTPKHPHSQTKKTLRKSAFKCAEIMT